jgi:hypothetical protein
MTTTGVRTQGWAKSGGLSWAVAILLLLALVGWARTAGHGEETEVEHVSPGTVEHVEGSDISVVTLTPAGAEKIGLEQAQVRRVGHAAGTLAVPHEALIHDADGTIWVYVAAGDPLRFRREAVEVATVDGGQAILSSGPAVGTSVAGAGAAELYGTEFEVGH